MLMDMKLFSLIFIVRGFVFFELSDEHSFEDFLVRLGEVFVDVQRFVLLGLVLEEVSDDELFVVFDVDDVLVVAV